MSHFCMPSLPVVKSRKRIGVTLPELVYAWAMNRLGLL
jgi:hypothetical protein